MNPFGDAVGWLTDPLNWHGHRGVPALTAEHLAISGIAVGLACGLAWPTAVWLGHLGRGGGLVAVLSTVSRAVPTLALLTLFAATPIGFGDRATVVALAVFAVPPLVSYAHVGVREVDRDVVEAARGMGMSAAQVLWRVEIPLALPLIATGFRTAAVQVVATASLAALVGGGGLGTIVNDGFGLQRPGEVMAGAFLIALLALVIEVGLATLQRALAPGRAAGMIGRTVLRKRPS
ncbi:MAG: ABC transporter permease [Actinobacteria bacterium]|nr:ABC transporter permease [Actinomycetota bacterium]MBI3687492.1 ABC transporter permease [Actinomycetota bacterium]